jgi:hypothetical protein
VLRETGYLLRSEVRLVGFEGQVGSRSRGGEH